MHYEEGTIEIFGIVLGLGFALVMVIGAGLMSRMLARDEEEAQARERASGRVLSLHPQKARSQDRNAA